MHFPRRSSHQTPKEKKKRKVRWFLCTLSGEKSQGVSPLKQQRLHPKLNGVELSFSRDNTPVVTLTLNALCQRVSFSS